MVKNEKQFPAAFENLYDMLGFISSFAKNAGFSDEIVKNIELVVEEALVNVITHGYKKEPGKSITIALQETASPGIEITIVDEGIPVDPDSLATVPKPLSKNDALHGKAEIGGWGLFLIHKIMDKVEYTREEGKNVLRLEKKL